MFVGNKFIIGGRYYNEKANDYVGILNIFNSDDQNFVPS
jgi:hypothetical protein